MRTGRGEIKFAGDVFDAERQRTKVVRIEENTAQRDTDYDAGVGPTLRTVVDQT